MPREEIRRFVHGVVREFDPDRIVLFGSHARGSATADSDVDLLVIMPTAKRGIEQAIDIRRELPRSFGLDLIVRTPEEVERRTALGDCFLREVLTEGTVMYERTHE